MGKGGCSWMYACKCCKHHPKVWGVICLKIGKGGEIEKGGEAGGGGKFAHMCCKHRLRGAGCGRQGSVGMCGVGKWRRGERQGEGRRCTDNATCKHYTRILEVQFALCALKFVELWGERLVVVGGEMWGMGTCEGGARMFLLPRPSMVVQYSFYKNWVFNLTMLIYAFYSAFSAQVCVSQRYFFRLFGVGPDVSGSLKSVLMCAALWSRP
eukprot:363432-Chlamydomonas_euryale.AAC.3